MRRSIVIVGTAALSACQKPGGPPAPISDAQAQQIASAMEADYGSGDAGKMAAHYARNAVVFDSSNAVPTTDAGVVRQWLGGFASMKPGDFQVSERHIQVLDGDTFVSSGIAHFSVAAGQARPTVAVRFSQVYERQKDGSWKIVHEHMSQPPAATPAQ